jgi:esterase/lipase/8-oxo-dGTP pyrophosphatase MutT (NUDIX family)
MDKTIRFNNSKGQRLVGVLNIPKGQGQFAAVILLHGFTDNHHHHLIRALAKDLEGQNFAVLRFSFSGHKPSQGGYKEVTPSQLIKDIESAFNFLKKNPKISPTRIGLVGHSLGGFTALIFAGIKTGYINSVVSLSSFYDLAPVIQYYERERKIKQFDQDCLEIDGFKFSRKLITDKLHDFKKKIISQIHCPVLIIHGNRDKMVPKSSAREIYHLLDEPKGLKILKDSDHDYKSHTEIKEVSALTVTWLKRYLQDKDLRGSIAYLKYQGKILLIKRSHKVGNYKDCYAGVGGYIPEGETALQTIKREILEELKIKGRELKLLKIGKPYIFKDPQIDTILHVHPFLFEIGHKVAFHLNWENTDYKWLEPKEAFRYKIVPHLKNDYKALGLLR